MHHAPESLLIASLFLFAADFAGSLVCIAMICDGNGSRRFSLRALFIALTMVAANVGIIAGLIRH